MNLGGSGANGLKWFAILACNSLQDFNWDDMQNNIGVYPYNGNLHLLLGTDSVNSTSSVILQYWAMYMNFGRGSFSPLTLRASWYQAARDAYSGHNYANTVKFSVAGDAACMNDYVQTNHYTPPQGSWTYDSTQVWPYIREQQSNFLRFAPVALDDRLFTKPVAQESRRCVPAHKS
jgi:hypothetical protein